MTYWWNSMTFHDHSQFPWLSGLENSFLKLIPWLSRMNGNPDVGKGHPRSRSKQNESLTMMYKKTMLFAGICSNSCEWHGTCGDTNQNEWFVVARTLACDSSVAVPPVSPGQQHIQADWVQHCVHALQCESDLWGPCNVHGWWRGSRGILLCTCHHWLVLSNLHQTDK